METLGWENMVRVEPVCIFCFVLFGVLSCWLKKKKKKNIVAQRHEWQSTFFFFFGGRSVTDIRSSQAVPIPLI